MLNEWLLTVGLLRPITGFRGQRQLGDNSAMKNNTIKRTLREGGVCLGTMVFGFTGNGVAQLAARAGADFVLFDMEHTGWGIDTIRVLLAVSRSADTVPLVRVPATEYHYIARVLDVGSLGVMVPMVEDAEQARNIVSWSKYPPQGRRGAAFGVAHDDYAGGDLVEKMSRANAETLTIVQIETAKGLDNVEAIAAVPDLDVLWVGLFDLTNFLGIPGQMSHPKVDEALARTAAAATKHGKSAGVLVGSVEEGKQRLAQGFRCIAYGGDLWLYQRALAQGLQALRG